MLGTLAGGCGGDGAPPPAPPATAATAAAEARAALPAATAASTPTAGGTAPAAPTSVPGTAAATPAPPPTPVASPAPGATGTAERTPRAVAVVPALEGRRFDRPTDAAAYPGGRVLIAEQSGLVLLLDRASGEGGIFLDLRREVSREGNEEGLLGLALAPDFAASGHLYAYYSVREGARRTRLSRFTAAGGAAEPASELVILEVAQPFSNHNGGALRFGPDGMLYLGLGDGGSAGDPASNAQDPGTLLGSILRIDVRSASEAAPYRVPEDNPFVGIDGARAEIWAYGLRNPWRMAFDPAGGSLWVGDVGQNRSEEVDVIVRGGNYGWNRLEGDSLLPAAVGLRPGRHGATGRHLRPSGRLLGHRRRGLPGGRATGARRCLRLRRLLQRAPLGDGRLRRGPCRPRRRHGRLHHLLRAGGGGALAAPLRRPRAQGGQSVSAPLLALVLLFLLYVALVSWQMRRALQAPEPRARLVEARRLLLLVTLGVPLAVAFILLAG